jgi:hypothetical protein
LLVAGYSCLFVASQRHNARWGVGYLGEIAELSSRAQMREQPATSNIHRPAKRQESSQRICRTIQITSAMAITTTMPIVMPLLRVELELTVS